VSACLTKTSFLVSFTLEALKDGKISLMWIFILSEDLCVCVCVCGLKYLTTAEPVTSVTKFEHN
jgi:hypothetical protein